MGEESLKGGGMMQHLPALDKGREGKKEKRMNFWLIYLSSFIFTHPQSWTMNLNTPCRKKRRALPCKVGNPPLPFSPSTTLDKQQQQHLNIPISLKCSNSFRNETCEKSGHRIFRAFVWINIFWKNLVFLDVVPAIWQQFRVVALCQKWIICYAYPNG